MSLLQCRTVLAIESSSLKIRTSGTGARFPPELLKIASVTAFTFTALIILWYLINIPLGVNGFVFI